MRKRMMAVVITLIMTSTFVGCSSAAAPAKETKETEAMVVKEGTVEVAEVKEVEVEPTPKPTPEPMSEATEEPIPEPIVYEGIDMESTLPGVEWIATFDGIINEPKIVIFNDETNKKLIVENGREILLSDEDVFAVYRPDGQLLISTDGVPVEKTIDEYKCTILYLNNEALKSKIPFIIGFNTDETVSCTLISESN